MWSSPLVVDDISKVFFFGFLLCSGFDERKGAIRKSYLE
jgi:hypothetical protein